MIVLQIKSLKIILTIQKISAHKKIFLETRIYKLDVNEENVISHAVVNCQF